MTDTETPLTPAAPAASQSGLPSAPTPAARVRRRLAWLLVQAAERRPRAGLRVAGHSLMLYLATRLTGLVLAVVWIVLRELAPTLVAPDPVVPDAPSTVWWLIGSVLRCGSVGATVWLACRFFDRRSFSSLGLALDRRVFGELGTGLILAGAMQATMFVLAGAQGWLRISSTELKGGDALGGIGAHIAWMTLVFLCVAWHEELLARGYWLVNLQEGLGRLPALVLSSLAFALAHMGNPNANASILPGLVGAGALFAWAALRSGRLWLPIGMHLGWNLFEGPIFGFPVSGLRFASWAATEVAGPPLWTGGAFGPEAGLLLVPALGVGVMGVWLATRSALARATSAV